MQYVMDLKQYGRGKEGNSYYIVKKDNYNLKITMKGTCL